MPLLRVLNIVQKRSSRHQAEQKRDELQHLDQTLPLSLLRSSFFVMPPAPMTNVQSTPLSSSKRELIGLLFLWIVALLASGWHPTERSTWWMEVAPALMVAPILIWSHSRFPLTSLLYRLIFIHGLILMLGGAYTYAEVPLGYWMQDWFGFARNNYDKIGHFAQGFIPAIATREILLRTSALTRGRWLSFLTVSVCLAISAVYELIEWWAAVALGQGADAFLGTQGYAFDTQSDMFLALIGAVAALVFLSRLHDRQLNYEPL